MVQLTIAVTPPELASQSVLASRMNTTYNLSVESQDGVNAFQRYAVENQKGAIGVQSL